VPEPVNDPFLCEIPFQSRGVFQQFFLLGVGTSFDNGEFAMLVFPLSDMDFPGFLMINFELFSSF